MRRCCGNVGAVGGVQRRPAEGGIARLNIAGVQTAAPENPIETAAASRSRKCQINCRRFDINLAPLETSNPFCEAKSELKYFEAALVDVPTVGASPTAPFAATIRHGETGFLAADETEWYAALKRLVTEPGLRALIARNAFFDVLWRYGPERRAEMAEACIEQVLGDARTSARFYELEVRRKVAPRRPLPEIPELKSSPSSESERRATWRSSCRSQLRAVPGGARSNPYTTRRSARRGSSSSTIARRGRVVAVAKRWMEQHGHEFTHAALLRNRQNSGLALTRNAGFSFSEARYVMPLDADNMIETECLERCLSAIVETGAAVAFPAIQQFGWRRSCAC